MKLEMNRELIPTTAFTRAARKYLKRHPQSQTRLRDALKSLSNDAFAPSLKTHKLKGELKDAWACSVEYDLRILFQFVDGANGEAILLLSVGSHDSVY